jgi:hypothetical protein
MSNIKIISFDFEIIVSVKLVDGFKVSTIPLPENLNPIQYSSS